MKRRSFITLLGGALECRTSIVSTVADALRSTIGHASKLTLKGDRFRPYTGDPE